MKVHEKAFFFNHCFSDYFSLKVNLHKYVVFSFIRKMVLNYFNFLFIVKYFNCWIL